MQSLHSPDYCSAPHFAILMTRIWSNEIWNNASSVDTLFSVFTIVNMTMYVEFSSA